MDVLKALGRINPTDVAYVCFLSSFVALGTFVYALAVGSALAWIIGASLAVLLTVMVVGFRVGARRRAESNDSGIEIEGANVWIRPLRREQIDQYLLTYRGVRDNHERLLKAATALPVEPTVSMDRRAA